jgi:hypothetical protein
LAGLLVVPSSGCQWLISRSSPNQDLAKDFLERYLLTEEELTAMDHGKALGIPALLSLQEKMGKDNPHLQQLKACLDYQADAQRPPDGAFLQLTWLCVADRDRRPGVWGGGAIVSRDYDGAQVTSALETNRHDSAIALWAAGLAPN